MSMMESVAYLKGLAQGLDINETTKEGKLLLAIVDVLDEMAESISDIEDVCEEFDELIDVIDEDLGDLEEDFYGLEDDDCNCDCDCDCDEEDDEDFFDEEDELYEVTCPNCNDVIYLNEEMLLDGDMDCPNCKQKLEFDFDDCCCGDDCGCSCSHEEE